MAAIDLTGSDKGTNGMEGRRRKIQSADEVVIIIADDSDNDDNDEATAQSSRGNKKGESRSTNAMSGRPIDLAALHSERETRKSSAAALERGGQGGKGMAEDVQDGQLARAAATEEDRDMVRAQQVVNKYWSEHFSQKHQQYYYLHKESETSVWSEDFIAVRTDKHPKIKIPDGMRK